MTEFLEVADGRIAYDVTGEGPLVVLSHGIGDRRQAYRFLAPKLAQAGPARARGVQHGLDVRHRQRRHFPHRYRG